MLKRPSQAALSKPISLLTEVGRQARNYTRVILWLVYDAFHGHVWKLASALTFYGFYLAGQIGAIGLVYGYARLMERHEPFKAPLLGITIDPGQPQILWGIVGVVALMLLASGVFLYLSSRLTFKIAEENLADSLKALVVLDGRLPDPRAPMASRMLAQHDLNKILAGARRSAFLAVISFNALAGMLSALVSLVFLFGIDPMLTVLILAGVALGALCLYPVALRGVRLATRRERTYKAFTKELRELQQSGLSVERGSQLKTPAAFAAAFMGRRKTLAELTLVLGIAVTIILAVVVYYMASEALSGTASWAIFIAYIGALRLVLSGSTQMIRAFAGISRFYPQIVPFYAVMRDSSKLDRLPLAAVHHGEIVFLGAQANGDDITVKGGDRIAVATVDSRRYVQLAMSEAKIRVPGEPVGTTIVRSGNFVNGEAGIAVIEPDQWDGNVGDFLSPAGPLRNKVALFIHHSPETVGTCGETNLLTIDEGAIERFLPLKTRGSDLVLEEFAHKAIAHKERATFDDDDDDDDI
jgi:hypothetical protein